MELHRDSSAGVTPYLNPGKMYSGFVVHRCYVTRHAFQCENRGSRKLTRCEADYDRARTRGGDYRLDVPSGSTFCTSRSNRGSDRSTSKSGSTIALTRDVQRRREQASSSASASSGIATLREAPGGYHERPILPVRLSALAQQRRKAATLEGACDDLRPLRGGHAQTNATALSNRPW